MKQLYFTEHRFLSFLLSVLGVFVLYEAIGAERVLETVEAVPEVVHHL